MNNITRFYPGPFKAVAGLMIVLLNSCSCEPEDTGRDSVYIVKATGMQLNSMPGNYTGKVELAGSFNPATNSFLYHIKWEDLTGPPAGGGLFIDHTSGGHVNMVPWNFSHPLATSGEWHSTIILNDLQESQLLNGQKFFILRTEHYPAGEISGRLMATL